MSILESPYKYIPPEKYSEFEDICLTILTPALKTQFTLLGNRARSQRAVPDDVTLPSRRST